MGCNQNGQASTDVETADVDTKMRMRMMLMMIIYGAHLRIKRFTYPTTVDGDDVLHFFFARFKAVMSRL